MSDHDFKAVLGGGIDHRPGFPGEPPEFRISGEAACSAVYEALRRAAKQQEDQEALARGEAERVRLEIVMLGDGACYQGVKDDGTCDAVLTAIVRKPKPQEVQADVD